ncbi:hypothetical protein HGRIS_009714 [Hohenbuehelia grisea]|uniref:EthD domain-containing protein n=1 Tax=Hohenbuehelia grisea TaxID=104357 RepID=A0ABR3J2K7_9AGAR
MPQALLAVSSEPGENVSLEEFQDWYNNEHVPIRLNHLSCFLTGARFEAADAKSPSWLALYDIDDTSTFTDESYTSLRKNRSPREADLIKRLELLDRRTYETFLDSGESSRTSSLKYENPTRFLFTHGLQKQSADPADRDVEEWFKTTMKLNSTGSWVRTRVLKCIDNIKTGTKVDEGAESQNVPRYLVIHELLDQSVRSSIEVSVSQASLSMEIVEARGWQLYRAYPCVAQGNVSSV